LAETVPDLLPAGGVVAGGVGDDDDEPPHPLMVMETR